MAYCSANQKGPLVMQSTTGEAVPLFSLYATHPFILQVRHRCKRISFISSYTMTGKPVLLDQWPSEEDKACHYEFEWRTHVRHSDFLDSPIVDIPCSMHARLENVASSVDCSSF